MFGIDDALIAAAMSAAVGAYGANKAGQNADAINSMTADQLHLAKADRTDAYGNRVHYDPATNSWQTLLTPEQKALNFAGEREQRLGLTQDAVRNRAIRERLDAMGRGAGEDYNTARSGFASTNLPSEGESRSEILRLMQQGIGQGDRALNKLVSRQALRQQGNMPVINTGQPSIDVGGRLADTMAKARSQAIDEVGKRAGARNTQYLPGMQQAAQVAGGGAGQFSMPDTEKTLLGEIDKSATGVNNAYHSAEGATNAAATNTTRSLAGLASSLARAKLGGGKPAPYNIQSDFGPGNTWGQPSNTAWANPDDNVDTTTYAPPRMGRVPQMQPPPHINWPDPPQPYGGGLQF